ncbi:MAG: DEAD/DEAH box helicase [Planctomycetota bacterium]
MDLGDDILDAIDDLGFTTPTEIQALAIPQICAGRDVVGRAQTGSGKTLAFGAPMLDRIDEARVSVLALVLCPTRELARQVFDVFVDLTTYKELRLALVVGGESMKAQIQSLQKGCQVLVGTPGRVLDLVRQKWLSLAWVEFVVLDEADEMLEIGFLDDVTAILDATPRERQTLLFSATFPPPIMAIAENQMREPLTIGVKGRDEAAGTILQRYLEVDERDKVRALERILDSNPDHCYLVFCDSRNEVDDLYRRLRSKSYGISPLHGGYDQTVRTRIMKRFREGEYRALIATDVAARGIDVSHVTHVINFSLPRSLERYLHRIGRTGRAGAKGEAITFVTRRDQRDFQAMARRGKLDLRGVELPHHQAEGGDARRGDRRGRDGDGSRGSRTRGGRGPTRDGGRDRSGGDRKASGGRGSRDRGPG